MFKNLSPGAIGIRNYGLEQSLDLARKTGFAGVDFDIREAADLAQAHGADHVRGLFEERGMRPGVWGMPVAWRDDARWKEDVKALPELAAVGQAVGALRTQTWCPPSSDLPFQANFDRHAERFGAIAEALKPYGIRFGIEFIGPQTMRPADKQTFIYTMAGMLDLIRATGAHNLGLLLDAWHLYTSGGSIDDLDQLTNAEVVSVHVNDAPEGLSMAEYDDHDRRLPTETGVIDLAGFMRKLAVMGYDGPVTAEPFSQRVNSLTNPMESAQLTASYMTKLWSISGLT